MSLSVKWTPGPWTVDYEMDGDEGYSIAIPEIKRMLHDVEWADADDWERDLANARLISTAPDGLALAEMVLKRAEETGDKRPGSSWNGIVAAAGALVAKAGAK